MSPFSHRADQRRSPKFTTAGQKSGSPWLGLARILAPSSSPSSCSTTSAGTRTISDSVDSATFGSPPTSLYSKSCHSIPATIEVSENGRSIEIFPETPVSDKDTIGVYMNVFNPFNAGMYQFNALAQAPGDIPVSGYLGSWLIQIVPNNTN